MSDYYKHTSNAGVIGGLAYFVLFCLLYFMGFNPLGNASWIGFIVFPTMLVYSIKNYRDKYLDGAISFGKAFQTGLTTSFFYASFVGILVYLFGLTIGTDLVQLQIDEAMKGMEYASKYIGEDMTDTIIEELKKMNIGRLAWGDFQNKFIGGLILSLIIAAFLKKEKPLFDIPPPTQPE